MNNSTARYFFKLTLCLLSSILLSTNFSLNFHIEAKLLSHFRHFLDIKCSFKYILMESIDRNCRDLVSEAVKGKVWPSFGHF